jgi:DivIVA domain-containing protein
LPSKRGTICVVIWLWVVVLVVVLGTVAILAAGRDNNAMGEVYEDRPDRGIPTGRPLTSDDLDAVRFSTAVRGYRMDEVDALIDRMRADLMARERHEDTAHHRDSDLETADTSVGPADQAAPGPSTADEITGAEKLGHPPREPKQHPQPPDPADPPPPDEMRASTSDDAR